MAVNFMKHNFQLWGWDMTLDYYKNHLLGSLKTVLSAQVAQTVSEFETSDFPVLLIINK